MIISHKYRFIFIKNYKTAGSSIESYLHPYLGDDDIIAQTEDYLVKIILVNLIFMKYMAITSKIC